MDRFFTANVDLKRYRDTKYVWLKVNWSAENHNDAFLRRYPAIKGYPHLFVLDANGRLLQSQDTEELEIDEEPIPRQCARSCVKWAPRLDIPCCGVGPAPKPHARGQAATDPRRAPRVLRR